MAKMLEINVTQKLKSFIVSKKLYGIYGWFRIGNYRNRCWFLIFNLFDFTYKLTLKVGKK